MDTATLYPAGAFAAGLALTLCLCAWLTPRAWWRRPNLRVLGLSAAGAWGFGSLILAALPVAAVPAPLPAGPVAVAVAVAKNVAPTSDIEAGSRFRVHRDLNLRAGAGVDAPRLFTVPAGAVVIATGQRHGDWWQVTASVDGHPGTGWASSLWLRRSEEPERPK